MRRGALRLGASCSTPAVTDANGDQFTFGDPGAGGFCKAVELGVKISQVAASWHGIYGGELEQQPTNFELLINLKTAKILALKLS